MAFLRYELHFHTSEVSSCSKVTAADSVGWYKDKAYDGIVVTDHYTRQYFEEDDESSWEEQVDRYLSGYQLAVRTGRPLGLNILPGLEIRFDENNNDYLVFGIDRAFLIAYPELYKLGIRSFHELTHKNNMLVYQAHPMRNGMTVINPLRVDGLEGYNGNPRQTSRNDIATLWAQKHDMRCISGSDFHQQGDEGRGGVIFNQPVLSQQDLVAALASQAYTLITTDDDAY